MTRAHISVMMVDSNLPIIVYGNTRGLVSKHRTLQAARKSLARDQAGCRRQGGYSDASIYAWRHECWTPE